MRRLALCLVAGGLLLAGCGGDEAAAPTTTAPATSTSGPVRHPRAGGGPTTTTAPPAPAAPTSVVPPSTAPAAPPVTVDLCTEALTVAGDVELTFEEAATHFDALAARAGDPGLAAALQDLAAQFRAGNPSASTAGLDAWCPGAAG